MRARLVFAVFLSHLLRGPELLGDITSARLEIQGAGLRVETVSVTTGPEMITTIQTSFGGKTNDQAPAVPGLIAVGELTGPNLEAPLQLRATPGHRFQIPPLHHPGEYLLQNVRLMSGEALVQYAVPSLAKITVADIFQTSLDVRQLTPEQIRSRGINTDPSWQVYEYTFTFLLDSGEKVVVPFPVVVDPRTHVVTPVRTESDYGLLAPAKNVQPPRWTPPDVIPFEFPDVPGEVLDPGQAPRDRSLKPPRPRIPAALVIPNSLAVLHQFFAVALTVANGAPDGSTARLEDIGATMKIKVPDALRTVKTSPAVAFGQAVPVVDPNTGVTVLLAQAKGEAGWTLEGLKPGTHTVEVEVRATLRETGQEDVLLRATPSAAVVIHDPRFNLTFSHPDTVRKNVEYSTFAFITNISPQVQTLRVTDGLPSCTPDQTPNVCRLSGGPQGELTIAPGEMRVVEYRLRSGETGQVFATAGTVEGDVISASVQLHMGVSRFGIPLSPSTLVLPHYAQYVDGALVSSYLELLGLGYSLATAPLNDLTARLPRIIKTDVFYRATDIARAGQRIFVANAKQDAFCNLLLDLLGNSIELREWDQLRRNEAAGRSAGGAVVDVLREALTNGQPDLGSAVDAFASHTAHRGNFVLAVVHGPSGAVRPVALELRGTSGRKTAGANELSAGWLRELPFADISRFDALGRMGEIGVVGRVTEDFELVLTPAVTGLLTVEVLYPGSADGVTMRAHLEVQGTEGVPLRVPISKGAAGINVLLPNGGFVGTAAGAAVAPAPLAILGARQDLHLDADGHRVSLLFSRPIAVPAGVDLRGRFAGAIDFNRDGVAFSDSRPIFAAALQQDQRIVNLSFDHALSTNAGYSIAVSPIVDPVSGAEVSFAAPVVPTIDNDRPAGILYGRFLTGDNKPIPNAEVKLFSGHWVGCIGEGRTQIEDGVACNPFLEAPQYARTRNDGSFLFEYVPRDVIADPGLTGGYKAVGVTTEGRATSVEGAVRLPGRVHLVNLQLLGRGAAEGKVRYDNGEVAAGIRVHVSSTMFNVGRDAVTDAAGAFRVDDLAVGPITFGAIDEAGNVAFASSEIATPGQVAVKDLVIFRKPFPGTGAVYGRVTRSDTRAPVFGARVGVYSQGYGIAEARTDSEGRFEFTTVPAGLVTVLAAEWSVSRESAAADFDLRADESKEVKLSLSVTPPDVTLVRVTGRVLRENPLFPGDPTRYERVSGAIVNLAILTTTADTNGEFSFEGVPIVAGGQKTIRAYDSSTRRFASIGVPTLTEAGPNDVTVFIPANSYGTGTVRVRVISAAGLPVDGFRVIDPGYPPIMLTSVGSGLHEYRDAPTSQVITLFAVDGPVAYGEQVASGSIRLDFPGQVATMILRLPGQGTVRAKLRSDFDLIGDVSITYLAWDDAEQSLRPLTVTASTSENGVAGFATFASVPALQSFSVSSAHPVYGYAEQVGQLAYDGDVAIHTLQLNKLATVKGIVFAIDGVTPIAGAAVRLYDGRRDPGIVYTQADGAFVFHDVPAAVAFQLTAEVTQGGVFRVGMAHGSTPPLGGPAPEASIVLRRRGSIEGRVVYADYKVYDPVDATRRVADDTPGDYSDNAPVPLAKFWLRELDYPGRSFGSTADPLAADVGGRFALSHVFTGSLRAMGWSPENQELQGNWTGTLTDEGQLLTGVYIAIGGGGTGSLQVKVVDPNQQYLPIANAEVRLYRGGLFDLATTDEAGLARFDQLPVGSYGVDAYSKSLGKSGAGTGFTIQKEQLSDVRILLEFVGKVDGRLTDPMLVPAKPLPGVAVKLTASSFYSIASTDSAGIFAFEGVREGPFQLEAKDPDSNRWARGQGLISAANRRPFVDLELERTATLHVSVYLPDDSGASSGRLAGPFEVDVVQRCGSSCDYHRTLQGNALAFPGLFINGGDGGAERYYVTLREIGGAARVLSANGVFPQGSETSPLHVVYPAFGSAEVTVIQGGVAAQGARVEMWQGGERRTLYTDANGKATGTGFPLGTVSIQATSMDGRFSGAVSVAVARQSVPAMATIELGAYAGVSGAVEAEGGGPSIGTRVLATFGARTMELLTDSDGSYLFQGIPTSVAGTEVALVYAGPDGVTVGARQTVVVNNDWASRVRPLGTVRIDATPPQLVTLTPGDGSQNVSPDAPIRLTFSERLDPATVNASNLQLFAADGSGQVTCSITQVLNADKTFAVTLTPAQIPGQTFPLRSNTLYRLVVQSAIRDLTGHGLPSPRGFTFTTSDYAEPRILRLVPSDTLPLPAQVTLQFHFNEPIDAQLLNFHFYKLSSAGAAGSVVVERAGRTYVDPASSLYLAFAPNEEIEPQSYYRAVFSGVRDLQGNQIAPQVFHFFSFDSSKPYLRLVSPVPDGTSLVSGVQYTLAIDARNDSLDGPVATDLARVEFVRTDGGDAAPTAITASPFAYRFAAPEAPAAGITYSIRATATDLSGNVGPPSSIAWTVKPNAAPSNVALSLSSPSAYPGAVVTATVAFEDEGVLAPVQVLARGTHTDGTEYVRSETTEAKRESVVQPWPAINTPFQLPPTLNPATPVSFTATVTDVRGLSATGNATLTLMVDSLKPLIVSSAPAPETRYTLNSSYRVSAVVSDLETGVSEVQFVVDGSSFRVFTSASTPGPTTDSRTFTSPLITATARNVDTRIPIVVRAIDFHGNVAARSFEVVYVGVNDPTAPRGAWLCPIDRAVVPASKTAFALPLRVRAQDDVSVTSVRFRVAGLPDLAASRIGATDDFGAQLTIDTPPAGTELTITAVISDADATHTIEIPIVLDVVAFDRVIDATEAVDADTVQSYEGKSLLVQGSGRLVVNVPLTATNLVALNGGRIETLPTTLARERRLEVTVTDRLYVDCSSAVDATATGYLGGWGVNADGSGTRSDTAAGRTVGNTATAGATNAGGSYGGLGGANRNGGTNATYGSITAPVDLGSGGGGHPTDPRGVGGVGGGAVSLRGGSAPEATSRIVVAGAIRADASSGRNGGSGGSVHLHARQILVGPLAQITANGGGGKEGCGSETDQCAGGSGGRIALSAAERLDLPAVAGLLRAFGGATGPGGTILSGAAGTVYVRRPGQTAGELHIAQSPSASIVSYARSTPLTAIAVDRLVLGPWALARMDGSFRIAGVPDDLSRVEKDPTAIVVALGAVPTISATTTPSSGASVIRNTPVEVAFDLASVAGIVSAEVDFSAAPPPRITSFAYPVTVTGHHVTLNVPPDAPLGPSTLTIRAVDRADRRSEVVVSSLSVLDNVAPVIDQFSALPSSLYPGRSVTATLNATDDVAVTRVSSTARIGSNAPVVISRTKNEKVVTNETFTFTIPVDTPGGTPMTVEASVDDGFPGRTATSQSAPVAILVDVLPPEVAIEAPADQQLFEEAAGSFAVAVRAIDAEVAVKSVTAKLGSGATVSLTSGASAWTATIPIPPIDGEEILSFPLVVTATDYAGNSRPITINVRIRPTIDPNAPAIRWMCGRDATVPGGVQMKLRVEAVASNALNPVQKVEIFVDASPALLATNVGGNQWETTWTVPAGAGSFSINAVATASGGATRNIRNTIVAVVPDQVFANDASIVAGDFTYDNKIIAVTAGTLTIAGPHTFSALLVMGGMVTHPPADASLRLTGSLVYVSCDGAIDVTGRGYPNGATYPGAIPAPSARGGSHMGIGGSADVLASTFGSVIQPLEAGGGGGNGPGGGVVAVMTNTIQIDGAVRANGLTVADGSGAGGSVWIRTTKIGGSGVIEANGGGATSTGSAPGAGGGGAIAIEYTNPASVLPTVRAVAVNAQRIGGAGTTFVKGPSALFGELTIDSGGRLGRATELPSLGEGLAQPGSTGVTLVTDRAPPIASYFIGHWIEVDGKGTWRIAGLNGGMITLESGATVVAGDRWRGVYRFDNVRFNGPNTFTSRDPVRLPPGVELVLNGPLAASESLSITEPLTSEIITIKGNVATSALNATSLLVSNDAVLTVYNGSALPISATTLIVAPTGLIDMDGRGYPAGATYPGHTPAPSARGGSHLGIGGSPDVPASTFGSIHQPAESGGGGGNGPGGGVVTIFSNAVTVDGTIRANGMTVVDGSGAGGSVWIRTAKISGTGAIEANGGAATSTGSSPGGGGGGAIAVAYTDPASELPALRATAQNAPRVGGAGSVFLRGPGSIHGDLTIDNGGRAGRATDLPSLGAGTAQPGTNGAMLVTDRSSVIPPFFVGHFVRVSDSSGAPKGIWRIGTVSGRSATLLPANGETVNLAPGDEWVGLYQFDMLKLRGVTLNSSDPITFATIDSLSSTLNVNDGRPRFPLATRPQIAVRSTTSGDSVSGPAGAVADANAPVTLNVTNKRSGASFSGVAAADGSFSIPVSGDPGDTFSLVARDSFSPPLSSAPLDVAGSIIDTNELKSLTLSPSAVSAGESAIGTIRLLNPARGTVAVTVSSSSAVVSVPTSVTITAGLSSAQFIATTNALGPLETATVTAAFGSIRTASLTVIPAANALAAIAVESASIEGGQSTIGRVTLNSAAPTGGALVALATSDPEVATIPPNVLIQAGATEQSFGVTTARVGAATSAAITATYGVSRSTSLTVTQCTFAARAATPVLTPVSDVWIDEEITAPATSTGATLTSAQSASGPQSFVLTAPVNTTQQWVVDGLSRAVADTDSLVLHVLVNPCRPPREIVVTIKQGPFESRAVWGESHIEPFKAMVHLGVVPAGGEWRRLEVPIRSLGLSAAQPITSFATAIHDGEAWFDRIGSTTCVIATAPKPILVTADQPWFDDAVPAGATTTGAWTWTTTQAASGTAAHSDGIAPGLHDHSFNAATDRMTIRAGDVFYTYVLLDPCNLPRQIALAWSDGTSWDYTAYWGEDLITTGSYASANRKRLGPLPASGQWTRLEVPAAVLGLDGKSIGGMAFALFDGRAWFDAAGRTSRVNLTSGKIATQSSTYSDASVTPRIAGYAVDGTLTDVSITNAEATPWWEVDLGAVLPIEAIDIRGPGAGYCCPDHTANFHVLVSDSPFTSGDLGAQVARNDVASYYYRGRAGTLASLQIRRPGRYVRIQKADSGNLALAEVEIWAPLQSASVNLAGGRRPISSSTWSGMAEWFRPGHAVNGSINDSHDSGGGIFASNPEVQSWWEIDLGAVQPIGSVTVLPRIDCCFAETTDFYVLVSKAPFPSTSLTVALADSGVFRWYQGTAPSAAFSIPIGVQGRYVRIQRAAFASAVLSLAEVQVWSRTPVLTSLAKSPDIR